MARTKKRSFWSIILSPKVIIVIGLILLGLVSFALSKELARKHQVNQEILEVKKEIDGLEKKNEELASLIEYLNTDSYKEIQARQSLNMKKEGETAVAVTSVSSNDQVNASSDKYDLPSEEESSNIKKWWKYFFGKKNN